MQSSPFDPCFLFICKKDKLVGITGLATDDSAKTGNEFYDIAERDATSMFKTRKESGDRLRLLGFSIHRHGTTLQLCQDTHIHSLVKMEAGDMCAKKFRSIRSQLLFIAQSSRPDISYAVAQLAKFWKQKWKSNMYSFWMKLSIISRAQRAFISSLSLKYPTLDRKSPCLYVFVDAGYNTNVDGTSQLGVFVFIADKFNNGLFIHWFSSKCSRISRSMIASESHAFSQGYDCGIFLRLLFKKMCTDMPLYDIYFDFESVNTLCLQIQSQSSTP